MIRETQIDAWESIQESLSEKRLMVLREIKRNSMGIALFQISENLRWPINRVSGRVTELYELGYIRDSGSRAINPRSGKQCIKWQYAPSTDRIYRKRLDKNQEIIDLRKQVKALTKELNNLKKKY